MISVWKRLKIEQNATTQFMLNQFYDKIKREFFKFLISVHSYRIYLIKSEKSKLCQKNLSMVHVDIGINIMGSFYYLLKLEAK